MTSLAIGDFSRATHMSVKTLRYYHRVGLLEPADVDTWTGRRRYRPEQIPTAQVIRRFRDLDMPIEAIRSVLVAPDVETRNALIADHLKALEDKLSRTASAVASLRSLLEEQPQSASVILRSIPVTPALAITTRVDDVVGLDWLDGVLGELEAALAAQNAAPSGPTGGIFTEELFTEQCGDVTIFVPCQVPLRPSGRATPMDIPAAELAVAVHDGAIEEIDRTYGALCTYVTEHALGVQGAIREYYPIGIRDTAQESAWRTEVCWPVFQTARTP